MGNALNKFFQEFMNTNKLIFAKLRDNVDEKQNTLLNSLDNINRKISLFYNEEDMVKNPSTFSRSIRNLDLNLRKN